MCLMFRVFVLFLLLSCSLWAEDGTRDSDPVRDTNPSLITRNSCRLPSSESRLKDDVLPFMDSNLYSGFWLPGNYKQDIVISNNWVDFTTQWEDFGNNGMRMEDYESFTTGIFQTYVGVFDEGNFGHFAFVTSDWNAFTQQWDSYGKENLRMHDFESYLEGGVRMYAGVFRSGKDNHAAYVIDDWKLFTDQWDTYGKQGLRMHDFETFVEGGRRWYAGIFREGTDNHAAFFSDDWKDFADTWSKFHDQDLRMTDYEQFDDGKTTYYGGIFREGNKGSYAWMGVEWENITSKWQELMPYELRLVDLEAVGTSACGSECMNKVVMQCDPSVPADDCRYDYGITATSLHCAGDPDNCMFPLPGAMVTYRQPAFTANDKRYIRLSALDVQDKIFTLPFSDQNLGHNGWMYGPGSWHHAVDYGNAAGDTFVVKAAAPGRVIYVGWDLWSGNTMILSHDAGGVKDAYRTIYMHLRNGAKNDCATAWSKTIPWLQSFPDQTKYDQYKAFLEATGCPSNPAQQNPDSPQWGDESQTIDSSLIGATVDRGDVLGYAGSTGPGGCGCAPDDGTIGNTNPNNHLHIFFAKKDTDTKWYFFDPYGIYAMPQCYPAGMTDPLDTAVCARYPIAWKDSQPQYP